MTFTRTAFEFAALRSHCTLLTGVIIIVIIIIIIIIIFLIYFQVVSAVPRHLVERARANPVNRAAFLSSSMFHLSQETSINLTKMKNKDYYRLLINKEQIELKANS